MMMVMRLIMLVAVMIKMPAASAPGSEVDNKYGPKASLAKQTQDSCYKVPFGATEIPSNIPSRIQCLEVNQTKIRVIPQRALSSLQHLWNLLKKIHIHTVSHLTSISFKKKVDLIELVARILIHIPTVLHQKNRKTLLRNALFILVFLLFVLFSDLEENSHIEKVPANAFRGLCTQAFMEIRLTRNGIKEVASDAFNGTKMKKLSLKGNQQLTHINPNAFVGSSELVTLDISQTALSSLPDSILGGLTRLFAESAFHLKELPPLHLFTKLRFANLTYSSHCCAFQNMHRNRSRWHSWCVDPSAKNYPRFYRDCCSNSTSITCTPAPDDFNPCEDIMSGVLLRVLIWIISILALLGNAVVLLVLLGTRSKLTVPRFLMCHLAFADLCMGIYLVVIATVDMLTRGRYYNHAIDWQMGLGCNAAGFFTVFASELSVFTLTAITVERWHTITHALRLDQKLRLRHACIIMTAGWIFSSLAAMLPTVGVSSYGKVSICLPMDVETLVSQVYVVSLLLLNILAFFCVCGCYLSIYLTFRKPSSAPAHADTRVAQRMAILIFTDFICMAPISFFAVSAALKLPLITVSDSKLLLVLFYPINSCSNPFLYAFFTRTFRQDFFLLAARFGLFKTQAQIYRTESSSCQQPAWTSPKSSRIMTCSLANTLSLDGKQES
uniref:Thyroid stimulating hormone receptor n=1 Tax=Amphiprion percula TaxID=161767 RepID=A0A3P8U3X6_AMPPE